MTAEPEHSPCVVSYRTGFYAKLASWATPVLEQFKVEISLEWHSQGAVSLSDLLAPRTIGSARLGVFKPLHFPGRSLPFVEPDIRGPIADAWDGKTQTTVAALQQHFPAAHAEFLVFAAVEVDPLVAGHRIGLAVMADIINRFLSPGGIALLNPYPLEFLGLEFMPHNDVKPGDIRKGVECLRHHYARLPFESVPGLEGLMALVRPREPIVFPANLAFTREFFESLPEYQAGLGD